MVVVPNRGHGIDAKVSEATEAALAFVRARTQRAAAELGAPALGAEAAAGTATASPARDPAEAAAGAATTLAAARTLK